MKEEANVRIEWERVGAVDVLLDGFVGYQSRERGVTVLTVERYVAEVRRFLVGCGGIELRELTAADVSKAVLAQVGGRSPAAARSYGCALRSFLRYCYLAGLVEKDLSAAALPVWGGDGRCYRKASLRPKRSRCCGPAIKRRGSRRPDYEVIVLILRLGLRASEVANLRLDDLDWRGGS